MHYSMLATCHRNILHNYVHDDFGKFYHGDDETYDDIKNGNVKNCETYSSIKKKYLISVGQLVN